MQLIKCHNIFINGFIQYKHTFMYLADTFIQSFYSQCVPWDLLHHDGQEHKYSKQTQSMLEPNIIKVYMEVCQLNRSLKAHTHIVRWIVSVRWRLCCSSVHQ